LKSPSFELITAKPDIICKKHKGKKLKGIRKLNLNFDNKKQVYGTG